MPKIQLTIDNVFSDCPLNFILCFWCTKLHHNELRYLNSGHRYEDHDAIRESYYQNLPYIANSLASELVSHHFDCIISAPSSRHQSREIKDAMIGRIDFQNDISEYIDMPESPKAGKHLYKKANDILKHYKLANKNTTLLTQCHSLLVIDDVFCNGRTFLAIIEFLSMNGLNDDCKFYIAAPLFAENTFYETRPIPNYASIKNDQ